MEIKSNYNFSPYSSEFDVMARLQNDYDAILQSIDPLNLKNISDMFDGLE
jgi:hypothetical protein